MTWSGWLCLFIGFFFGSCSGLILGLVLADNYWRKKLIKEQKYDKIINAKYEIEKGDKQDGTDSTHEPKWW